MIPKPKPAVLVADSLEKDEAHRRRWLAVRDASDALAAALRTSVRIFHAEPIMTLEMPNYRLLFEKHRSELARGLEMRRRDFRVASTIELALGDPVQELVRAAAKRPCPELIAMATRARRGLGRLLLGSVTEDVVRHASVPVMTVGPGYVRGRATGLASGRKARILFGTDLGSSSRAAEKYAASLARRLGAEVVVVHCLYEGFHPVLQTAFRAARRRRELDDLYAKLKRDAERGLERCVRRFANGGVRAEAFLDIAEIEASDSLLARASERRADLVVIGTHARGIVAEAILGGSAREVILRSPVPVITVR